MAFETRDYNSSRPFGRGGGGGFGGGGGMGMPSPGARSVTTRLIVFNCAVLLLGALLGRSGVQGEPRLWDLFAFNFNDGIRGFQVWRLFTYQFLHNGLWHLFGNMLILFFFGPRLEQSLGARRFLAYYLLCGICGGVVAAILTPISSVIHPDAPLVGASGAVLGVLVATAVKYPDEEILIFLILPVKVRVVAIVLLFVSVFTLLDGGENAGGEAAHLGGILLGFLLTVRPRLLDWAGPQYGGGGGFGGAKRGAGGIEGMKTRLADFQRERKRKAAAAHASEVDRILGKVSASGIQSLSEKEKRTLAEDTKQKR